MLLAVFFIAVSFAQNTETSDYNGFGAKLRESNFHLNVDLQTKYIWRGMEMMTENASPVTFPSISYSYKGLYVYGMGGYAFNGKYAEVDLGASYTYKWWTVGINDYYYPATNSPEDKYFNFKSRETGHWFEGVITVAPEKFPVYLTVSNFFAGADKKSDGKQAYSTYAEIGSHYDFLHDNSIAFAVGAAFNESCYNDYEHGFGVCNVELKYTYTVHFKKDWSLPLSAAYILNPVCEKSFFNFTMHFGF